MSEEEKKRRRAARDWYLREKARIQREWAEAYRRHRKLEEELEELDSLDEDELTEEQEARQAVLEAETGVPIWMEMGGDKESLLEDARLEMLDRYGETDSEDWQEWMTESQFESLTGYGQELAEWRAHWMPFTCQKMEDAEPGSVLDWCRRDGEAMLEIVDRNQKALGQDGAEEIARDMYKNYQEAEV